MKPLARASLALAALFAPGCSWGRFDTVKEDAPVVILGRPGGIASGFGSSLAVASRGPEQILLVGGVPVLSPAALWSLGSGEDPAAAPITARVCADIGTCKLLGSAAAAPDLAGGQGCFVSGAGPGGSDLGAAPGLLGACANGVTFKLAVPDAFGKGVLPRVLDPLRTYGFAGIAALASLGPSLVVGSPDAHAAWAYDLGAGPAALPILFPVPDGADYTFGLSVAVMGQAGARLAAVSAPGQGRVFVYAIDAGRAELRGCVARGAPFGVVLAGLTDGEAPRLAVSDGASLVEVLDPAKIAPGPGCGPPGPGVLLQSYRCQETGDVTGCAGGDFGYALAAGDLDGDGHPEVLVGAPGLAVRGAPKAGAVQVFVLADPTDAPRDTLFVASSEHDEHVGMTLAAARVEGRDIVVAGGPGKSEVALFYCSALGGASGRRCQ